MQRKQEIQFLKDQESLNEKKLLTARKIEEKNENRKKGREIMLKEMEEYNKLKKYQCI